MNFLVLATEAASASDPIDLVMHWVPTPLLALGFWTLMKKSFTEREAKLVEHEQKFKDLLGALEKTVEQLTKQDKEMARLRDAVERHEKEISDLRSEKHRLGNELTRVMVKLELNEGSGPKRDPRQPHRIP